MLSPVTSYYRRTLSLLKILKACHFDKVADPRIKDKGNHGQENGA